MKDSVREKIIKKVVEALQHHKFSETTYPIEVKIETRYDDSRSTLTITFEEDKQ